MGGVGCKARGRGGEGIWKAKLAEKASERQSHLSLDFALYLGVPQSGLDGGNETETEVWFLVCCR